ncbi:MAG TPA: hypothetical protein VGD83_21495 [Streptosporangiaceae bacterium]
MNARHLHLSARKNEAAVQRDHGTPAAPAASPADLPGRARCCPARAAVRVVMPSAQGRTGETDLPGKPPGLASWIREAA